VIPIQKNHQQSEEPISGSHALSSSSEPDASSEIALDSELLDKSAELLKSIEFNFKISNIECKSESEFVHEVKEHNDVGIIDLNVNKSDMIADVSSNRVPIVDNSRKGEVVSEDVKLYASLQGMYSNTIEDHVGFVYTADEFNRNETVVKVEGDGSCLYKSILQSIGLDQD